MRLSDTKELTSNDSSTFELADSNSKSISVKDVKLPYILKNKVIFSPGTHNGMLYTANVIERGYRNTQWNDRTLTLYHAHKDEFKYDPKSGREVPVGAEVDDLAGFVSNLSYMNGGVIRGDINVTDLNTAIKLMLGAKIGISPRGIHPANRPGDNVLKDMVIQNWSLTVNPAQKTTYLSDNFTNEFGNDVEVSAFAMSESNKFDNGINKVNNMSEGNDSTKGGDVTEKTAEEQLKELQTKHDSLLSDMDEMKGKVKEMAEEREKVEEPAEKEEEAEEEIVEEKPSTELTEEAAKIMNELPAEKLSEWTDLVKEKGIKEATRIYKEKKEEEKMSEQDTKIESLVSTIEKLKDDMKDKSLIPEIISPNNMPVAGDGDNFELSDHVVNEGMLKYLQTVGGIEVEK